jgi:hypothetical protein
MSGMIGFAIWFIIGIALLVMVIILAKWLLGMAGITIPQPILICLGILLFIIFLVALWHFIGAASFAGPSNRRISATHSVEVFS